MLLTCASIFHSISGATVLLQHSKLTPVFLAAQKLASAIHIIQHILVPEFTLRLDILPVPATTVCITESMAIFLLAACHLQPFLCFLTDHGDPDPTTVPELSLDQSIVVYLPQRWEMQSSQIEIGKQVQRHAFVDVKKRVLCNDLVVLCNDLVEACKPLAFAITFA
jgi:hypothetical protein